MRAVTRTGDPSGLMPFYDPITATAAPVGPETGHEAIAASVTPWSVYTTAERRWCLADDEWQAKVRRYDREGPGIVGAALDMPAATSMLLRLVVRRRAPSGDYEVIEDDPLLTAVLGLWAGEAIDQRVLLSKLIRTLDGIGECYFVLHNAKPGQGRMWWQLCQTTNVHDNKDGTTSIKMRPDARPGDQNHRIVPDRYVYRALTADAEWEGVAWAPMRRGLPHIEQYRAVMRNIGRNLDSQLAMNGVLWAKAVASKTEWPDHLRSWAHKAITSDEGIEAVVPFMMTTPEKPEWIDVGRGDHKDQIEVANLFLRAFAQSSDLPTNMLLEGPGQGNHWSAFLEGDFYADMAMAPRWMRAVQIITRTHFLPLLRALPDSLTSHLGRLADYEVWVDDARIRGRTDNSQKVQDAWDRGVATDEALAESAGLREDQVRDRPEGVESYENWLAWKMPSRIQGAGVQNLLANPYDDPGQPAQPDTTVTPRRPGLPTGRPRGPMGASVEVVDATRAVLDVCHRRRLPDYFHELIPTP